VSKRQGPQNFLLLFPPPVERQVAFAPAQRWQNVFASLVPASGSLAMSPEAQLKKQYIWPDDSNDAHTSLKLEGHSPLTAQQSASLLQAWVQ
jgi:hypothetical protein